MKAAVFNDKKWVNVDLAENLAIMEAAARLHLLATSMTLPVTIRIWWGGREIDFVVNTNRELV